MSEKSVDKGLIATVVSPLAVGILCFAMLSIAGLWYSTETRIARAHQAAVADIMRHNANLARLFEEHTIRTLDAMDAIVIRIVRQFEAEGGALDLPKLWAGLPINPDIVLNGIITDHTGTVILGSTPPPPISLADREHINIHFTADSGTLFIGKPILARITGLWSMPLTRRVNNPDGSLKGVVSIAVNPFFFRSVSRCRDRPRRTCRPGRP